MGYDLEDGRVSVIDGFDSGQGVLVDCPLEPLKLPKGAFRLGSARGEQFGLHGYL